MRKETFVYRDFHMAVSQKPETSFVQRMRCRSEIRRLERSVSGIEKIMEQIKAQLVELGAPLEDNFTGTSHLMAYTCSVFVLAGQGATELTPNPILG